jgi:hypothetical protein
MHIKELMVRLDELYTSDNSALLKYIKHAGISIGIITQKSFSVIGMTLFLNLKKKNWLIY